MWVENKQKPIASKRLVMWLIMQNNLHEDLLSLVGWWETILELLSWLDRIIHNAYQLYSYISTPHLSSQANHAVSHVRAVSSQACSLNSTCITHQCCLEHSITRRTCSCPAAALHHCTAIDSNSWFLCKNTFIVLLRYAPRCLVTWCHVVDHATLLESHVDKQNTSEIIISNSHVSPAMSHVCHMYSCPVSPAIFHPAIPAIIISTIRLTMSPSLLSQYGDPLRPIMLSIVPRDSTRLDLGVQPL